MNIIKWLPLAALLFPITEFQTHAQVLVDTAKIHRYLSIQQKQLGFNGVVCIARQGRILYEGSFGKASYELHVPMDATAVFKIASISKPFTAMLTLLACDEGRLRESDSLGKFYPQLTDTTWQRITIRQLLMHRSGIPHNEGIVQYWQEKAFLPLDRKQCLSEIFGMSLLFDTGTETHYSSPGYFLLADILEQLYRRPYAILLREKITGPLVMQQTGVYDGRAIVPSMATGYHQRGDSLIMAPHRDPSLMKGSGNLYASAADLTTWLSSFGGDRRPPAVVSKLFDEQMTSPMADDERYGYGWYHRPAVGSTEAAWYHGGGTFGCSAMVVWYPADQTSIVLLSNVSILPVNNLWADLERIILGQPFDLPRDYTKLELSTVQLSGFAGTYTAQGMELLVILHEGQLVAKLAGNPPFGLHATGPVVFFGPKAGVRLTFLKDERGQITGLVAERDGRPITFEKK